MNDYSDSPSTPHRARQRDALATSEDAIQRSLQLLRDTARIVSNPVLALRPSAATVSDDQGEPSR